MRSASGNSRIRDGHQVTADQVLDVTLQRRMVTGRRRDRIGTQHRWRPAAAGPQAPRCLANHSASTAEHQSTMPGSQPLSSTSGISVSRYA